MLVQLDDTYLGERRDYLGEVLRIFLDTPHPHPHPPIILGVQKATLKGELEELICSFINFFKVQ